MKSRTFFMKKRIPVIILLCVFALGLYLTIEIRKNNDSITEYVDSNTGGRDYIYEPEDDFSSHLVSSLDSNIWYQGRNCDGASIVYYDFKIKSYREDDINNIYKVSNSNYCFISSKSKIWIGDGPSGVLFPMVVLSNYSDAKLENPDYDGFYSLSISFREGHDYWQDLSLYTKMESIRRLELPDKLQKKAEKEGIDWYEVWPELEEVIVYETDDYGNRK